MNIKITIWLIGLILLTGANLFAQESITPTITTKASNTPPNALRPKSWVVTNETESITWTNTGSIPQVTILYSRDDFMTDIQAIITNTANTGTYSWKIPDAKSEIVKIRVYDASDVNLVTGAGTYGETEEFMIDYYHIRFNVLDDVTKAHLNTFKAAWSYFGCGEEEFGSRYYSSPVTHDYSYGTWTTAFTKINFSIAAVTDWDSDRDKEFTVYMESSLVHQWLIMADINYNPDNDTLHVTSWFERDGLLLPGTESVEINFYDEAGDWVAMLSSDDPDATGALNIDWVNPSLEDNTLYFVKITLTHAGKMYTSAQTYNISDTYGASIQAMADVNYNESEDTLEVIAWIISDGQIVTGAETATVEIYDFSGAIIKTLQSSTPDSIGVFRLSWKSPSIDSTQTYLARITLLDDGKIYMTALDYNIKIGNDTVTVTVIGSSGDSGSRGSKGMCGLLGIEPIILFVIILIVKRRKWFLYKGIR
jgi:hypothetical protein